MTSITMQNDLAARPGSMPWHPGQTASHGCLDISRIRQLDLEAKAGRITWQPGQAIYSASRLFNIVSDFNLNSVIEREAEGDFSGHYYIVLTNLGFSRLLIILTTSEKTFSFNNY